MGDINYSHVIDEMVWSYSRVKSFDDCPYKWYLKYIRRLHGKEMFFANYGTFIHKLIEQYYNGEKTKKQLCDTYLQEFKSQVHGAAPNKKIFSSYFTSGLQYLKGFVPFPYNKIAVEKKVDFKLNNIPFIGYIDFLGEKDDELYIIDNKSRTLKPRSNREKPTKTDEELDSYLKQLYIYSAAVEQEYGRFPKMLCFNCFRTPVMIEEQFNEAAYEEAKNWLFDSVARIRNETDFKPDIEYFRCTHLCEMHDYCEYYELNRKR